MLCLTKIDGTKLRLDPLDVKNIRWRLVGSCINIVGVGDILVKERADIVKAKKTTALECLGLSIL